MNEKKINTKTTDDSSSSNTVSNYIPLWEKYSLNFAEAAIYFGIGEKRLRSIVASNPRADYVLEIGTHIRIKRQKFIDYLDLADAI